MPLQPEAFADRDRHSHTLLPNIVVDTLLLALISWYKREMATGVPLPGKILCLSHLCILSPDTRSALRKHLIDDQINVCSQKLQEENLQAPHIPRWLGGAEAEFLTRQKAEGTRMCQKKNT